MKRKKTLLCRMAGALPSVFTVMLAWLSISPGPLEAQTTYTPYTFTRLAGSVGETVLAWGWNVYGQTNVPAGLSEVTAIAAGSYHTVALKSDGTVVAWGDNVFGQTTVPPGLSGVTAIAVGLMHTVALKSDGTVVAWGDNSYGQTIVPAGLSVSGVMAIAAGGAHTVALKTNGTVLAWGWNAYGQINMGVSGVAAIAAGGEHTVALKNDGTVVAWGNNNYGQRTVPAGLSGVTAIAAGGEHTVALATPRTPLIVTQPQSRTAVAGMDVSFSVTATSTVPLSYLWKFNGSDLAGQTGASLVITNVSVANAGSYQVIVSNATGSVPSAAVTLTVNSAPPVVVTGQWDFDQGDLRATVGRALEPFNAAVAAETSFGTTTSLGIPDIGGQSAHVMRYNALSTGAWGGYGMSHGAEPNGGGSYVNRYTVIYDLLYPTESNAEWRSFLQTNTGNSNDGDFFVNPANGIGISGNYTGNVTANVWHRIVFAVDLVGPTVAKYIDGVKVGQQTLDGLDGRWSLDPFALLFGDEDGDNALGYANSIQFRNGVMTEAEVAALGGPTAAGIPVSQTAELRITSIAQSGNSVTLFWGGGAGIKLQKSATLIFANWQDVAGSLGSSNATETIGVAPAFYRLVK